MHGNAIVISLATVHALSWDVMHGSVACMLMQTQRPLAYEKVRDLRLRARLSQADLARLCTTDAWQLSQSGVSRLERGLRPHPYEETVDALAAALGVPTEALLLDDEQELAA